MTSWHSYPSIYNVGHRAVRDILSVPVLVQEKVDGSQFSFGVVDGALKTKSKNQEFDPYHAPAMFQSACDTVISLFQRGLLKEGWTYRGEVLSKPKHNALAYDRVPKGNVILFDINIGQEDYMFYDGVAETAKVLDLEVVPLLYSGYGLSLEDVRDMLKRKSILGDVDIEGVVIKPAEYNLYGQDKKVLMAKFVSEAFKEVAKASWGESNPTKKDHIAILIERYAVPARWQKAVQHLAEQGKLEDSPRDIGLLIQEVPMDILKEEEEAVKEYLFKAFKKDLVRGWTRGLPEWYKQKLLEKQFEGGGHEVGVHGQEESEGQPVQGDSPTEQEPV